MNFYPNPSGLHRKTFLATRYVQRSPKNPLFGVISLHGSTGPYSYFKLIDGWLVEGS
jgi:hypothetical protein